MGRARYRLWSGLARYARSCGLHLAMAPSPLRSVSWILFLGSEGEATSLQPESPCLARTMAANTSACRLRE